MVHIVKVQHLKAHKVGVETRIKCVDIRTVKVSVSVAHEDLTERTHYCSIYVR